MSDSGFPNKEKKENIKSVELNHSKTLRRKKSGDEGGRLVKLEKVVENQQNPRDIPKGF